MGILSVVVIRIEVWGVIIVRRMMKVMEGVVMSMVRGMLMRMMVLGVMRLVLRMLRKRMVMRLS